MLKNILKLEGAKPISQQEQKNVKGSGNLRCCEWCSDGSCLDWTDGRECPISAGCPV